MSRRARLAALIALIALVARAGVVVADDDYVPAHDAFDYDRHALSIAAGDGFPESGYAVEGGPSALRAPAYPFALGATYAASGLEADGGRILNVGLGVLTVMLVLVLGSRIGGPRAGLIAGLLAAVFPPLVLMSRDLYSESLFIPIVLAAAIAAIAYRDDGRLRWVLAVGALCGLAALTRNPGPALLIPALIGVWALLPRLSLRALGPPALALLTAALVVVPWTARNAVEFGRFVPVTTSTGFALAGTYNQESGDDPRFDAAWRAPNAVPSLVPLFDTPGIDEATLDATLRREATEFARDHPGYIAETTWHNGLRLFLLEGASVVDHTGPVEMRGIGSGATTWERVSLALLAPLALAGAIVLIRRRPSRADAVAGDPRGPAERVSGTAFVWLIPLLLLLSAALVAGLPRYRLPADPFFLILAAIALAALADRGSAVLAARSPAEEERRRSRLGQIAAIAAVGLAIAAVGGCGSSNDDDPEGGAEPTVTTEATEAAAEISKQRYIALADNECARSLAETERIVDRLLEGKGTANLTPSELTTDLLVGPGLEIRRKLADRLAELPRPPADPDLETFLQLFPTTERLIEQRLAAGRAEDLERSQEIELQLFDLGAEQQQAAAAYGLEDCAEDFGSLSR